MTKQIKLTIGIGLAVVLLTAVFATSALAQGPGGGFGGMMGYGQGYGPGMMGQPGFGGMMGYGQGYGPGMMGQPGFGGAAWVGCPMFGAAVEPTNAESITFDQAVEAVQQYLKSYDNTEALAAPGPVLALAEVMEFDRNFYAVITDKRAGTGAFELLVDRYSGFVQPEPGPNMMWNTRYGHMTGFGGMMGMMGGRFGPFGSQQQGPVTLTVAQARRSAQVWLDANLPGAVLADDEVLFPGYYTLDFLKDGETAGMLSVNGYTGQVWYHTWHGDFIREQEF